MSKSKNIVSALVSTSLLASSLLSVLLNSQRAAQSQENVGTSQQPLETPTVITYCNRTSRSISTAIGYSPNWTAWGWRPLTPNHCRTLSFEKYNDKSILFFADVTGDQPFSRVAVSAGRNCFKYAQYNNNLVVQRSNDCPSSR